MRLEIKELNNFGKKYSEAWCSQNPEKVAEYFAVNGSLKVNNGLPAVGRKAIAQVADGFMKAFPDMIVAMDRLRKTTEGVEFHWTLTGANTGPNGTGKNVRISGLELWQIDKDGLISSSKGSFDSEEYSRQLKSGADN